MLVLGLETSCDETGVALYDSSAHRLLSHALHSQIAMHQAYGGVVPELASRDHIRRVLPLIREVLDRADRSLADVDAIAYTQGPGLAGALLVGTGVAHGIGFALDKPMVAVHHLEGHLLSPLLSADPPRPPFIALLVSGGHTQLMRVNAVGDYIQLGETLDDAAGEAFDKTAKLLGLSYPGGPELARLAQFGSPGAFNFPRPMLHSKDLDFSFSGLKTSVLTAVRQLGPDGLGDQTRADVALAFQDAIVDVLVTKSIAALKESGLRTLVVAGGVGANLQLREQLRNAVEKRRSRVYFPEFEWCTDNGAMIALAAALRLEAGLTIAQKSYGFSVRPRWPLESL